MHKNVKQLEILGGRVVKKKIISMVLALTLVVSGLPATSASAAELDNAAYSSIWAPEEETATIEETTNVATTVTADGQDSVVAVDYSRFNVNADGKVVGSDGASSDDVTYLSFNTVMALDADTQDAYVELCDLATDWAADGAENIVIAVDADGDLRWSLHMPGIVLVERQQELVEAVLNAETETATEELTVEESTAEEEESTKESTVEETATEEVSTVEEESMEETTVEEKESTEETTVEEAAAEEESTVDETTTEEEVTAEETSVEETTVEALELSAENMKLLPELVNEQVELADDVEVEKIDLGYGNAVAINSTLPNKSYFSGQLKGDAKHIYSAAVKALTAGNTTFTFSGGSIKTYGEDVCDAISAVVLTYPEKTDWMDPLGGWEVVSGKYNPITGKFTTPCTIGVAKSDYYSKELDTQAKEQVAKLAIAAQKYAVAKYPDTTTYAYGAVEYLDKWICENNYYNTPGGVNGTQGGETYYYCHSAYGALLKGYAVCESYAKAMSRMMDAVGIPNMYVIGEVPGPNGGGHAWNYVQMPDGVWYLLDSTWNNPSNSAADAYKASTKEFLLVPNDAYHVATGMNYRGQKDGFKFPQLGDTKYALATEDVAFTDEAGKVVSEKVLVAKEKFKLTCKNTEMNTSFATWSSSDTSVAKVDSKGNVTAVAPGTAVITLATATLGGGELKAQCTVKVYQVKGMTVARTGKASDTVSMGANEKKTVSLDVNVGAKSPYTAEELVEKKLPVSNAKNTTTFDMPDASSKNPEIAAVTAKSLDGNTINLTVEAKSAGKTSITVTFGGKKATINVTVGELIDKSMFTIDWAGAGVDEQTMSVDYSGKAIAPKVTPSDKNIKFKKTYLNNKNAGTASLIISGTGTYGGEIRYDFTINKLTIDDAHIDTARLGKTSNTYNGGSNPAKATVKYKNAANKKVSLKANTDYEIVYKNKDTKEETTNPVNAGTYTVSLRGKGNYAGTYDLSSEYTIASCEISKAKVTLTTGKKAIEPKVKVTVKLGKNVLPTTDYTITYYSDKKCTTEVDFASLMSKTTYYAKISSNGSNTKEGRKAVVKSFKTK